MSKKRYKVLVFSDVHLGHPKCPTRHVISNLDKYILQYDELGDIDIIFISGDFFDRLLNVPDPNVELIKFWINKFLYTCKKLNIILRVLEGTPSHDWGQSRLFESINEMSQIKCDVRYVDTLSIEHIKPLGIDVLYVPDEWKPETDDIWLDVTNVMTEKSLTMVDFSIMHGSFRYQLPSHVPAPKHIEERYLSITKHYIFIGHNHNFTTYERIIAPGSVDRQAHNQEEPKYFAVAEIDGDKHSCKMHEIKDALIFKTIKCSDLDLDNTIKYVESVVSGIPDGSHIKVAADKANPIFTNMDKLISKFPTINFSIKEERDEEPSRNNTLDLSLDREVVNITPKNIKGIMTERLKDKDPIISKRSLELLEGYV